jgi:glycerophosphoryl diester phosphodiesterase
MIIKSFPALRPALNFGYLVLFSVLYISAAMTQTPFDLQGHRGCRGLMPENTLPGFIHAVEVGVTTLELDVVISGDSMIVVSHEPWMSSEICTRPGGIDIPKAEEKNLNLYKMDYAQIQGYDCGQKFVERFPEQKKIPAVKPTLKMAVRMIRSFAEDNKYPQPAFNIELKSDPQSYGVYQPDASKFADMVATEVKRLGIEGITTLQSFDINVLEALHKRPGHTYKISYLVEKGKNLEKNLSKLSFTPDIYSPLYTLVTEAMVAQCHEKGIKVIPWTINDPAVMTKLKGWGIDGGITDYPDRVK